MRRVSHAAWRTESTSAESRQCEHDLPPMSLAVAELYYGASYRPDAQPGGTIPVLHHLPYGHSRFQCEQRVLRSELVEASDDKADRDSEASGWVACWGQRCPVMRRAYSCCHSCNGWRSGRFRAGPARVSQACEAGN